MQEVSEGDDCVLTNISHSLQIWARLSREGPERVRKWAAVLESQSRLRRNRWALQQPPVTVSECILLHWWPGGGQAEEALLTVCQASSSPGEVSASPATWSNAGVPSNSNTSKLLK